MASSFRRTLGELLASLIEAVGAADKRLALYIQRWPMVPVVCAMSAGMAAAPLANAVQVGFIISLLLLLFVGRLILGRPARGMLIGAWFLAGLIVHEFAQRPASLFDLRMVVPPDPVLATVQGKALAVRGVEPGSSVSSSPVELVLEAKELEMAGRSVQVSGKLLVRLRWRSVPTIQEGAELKIAGVLRRPERAVLPGLFDEYKYLSAHGLHAVLESDRMDDLTIIRQPRPSILRNWRELAAQWISRGLPVDDQQQTARLLRAVLLGYRDVLDRDLLDPFRKSGTMHLFAISGLHVGCVAAVVFPLLRMLRFPVRIALASTVIFCWLYTAATGWQVSAIRATTMLTVYCLGMLLRRPTWLLNTLATASFVILSLDPLQFHQPGYRLSFTVMAVLACALDLRRISEEQQVDLVPRARPPFWQRLLTSGLKLAREWLSVSFLAWLGSAYWSAYYFHLATPGAVLSNFFVAPLTGVVVAAGVGSLFTSWLVPQVGELFNWAAWAALRLLTLISSAVTKIPGSWFYISRMPFGLLLLIAWIATVVILRRNPFSKRLRPISFGLVIFLAISLLMELGLRGRLLRIAILPANAGGAIWIDEPIPWRRFLYDTGPIRETRSLVVPYLRSCGVNRLGTLLLSHGDGRHCGGTAVVIEELRPRAVAISPISQRSTVYRNAVEQVKQHQGINCLQVAAGQMVFDWMVLHPPRDYIARRADQACVVLYRSFGGVRILIMSDLEPEEQRVLIEKYPALRADLIICGEPHDERYPIALELVDGLRPQLILVMDGEYPQAVRFSEFAMQRLNEHGVRVLRTEGRRAFVIEVSRGRWRVLERGMVEVESGLIRGPEAEKEDVNVTSPLHD